MTEMIVGKSLSKTYRTLVDTVSVFENLELKIDKGSMVALVGESGRGKTTLLNIISGLDRPSTGEVWFGGERIDTLDEEMLSDFRNRHVGFIFQHHYLLEDFTALENVLLPLRIGGKTIGEKEKEKAKELLSRVGLSDRLRHYPDQLSGGERQRVAIVRALIHDPDVVFADEPTGSLDRRNADRVEAILWELCRSMGKTFVVATHNMELARKCDAVISL
ncbi:ABC transporter ATP-binding protein [Thermospira aquatica]|uniref:ABC transporter ATP-binding protein n=1 Tax=Thermospira aquatica TaxID=2828656 RepID=A0AAX3BDK1_9SPIR|nr:ABC transporter ATP-binding protein [Thermospira aquatica]URA10218.1 ABC transporter ATP-binding protein [Thermospira aquatica]